MRHLFSKLIVAGLAALATAAPVAPTTTSASAAGILPGGGVGGFHGGGLGGFHSGGLASRGAVTYLDAANAANRRRPLTRRWDVSRGAEIHCLLLSRKITRSAQSHRTPVVGGRLCVVRFPK